MSKEYIPAPFDTSGIELPEELLPLVEDVARNVHAVWAARRRAEGWTYGPVRDEAKKKTPCLVPYEELPEIEKDYDRATAQGTIKMILKLGFKITKS